MLKIVVPETELFDEDTMTFLYSQETILQLEHSLLSISKWESIFKKPFLKREEKTYLEMIEYIKCMTINPKVDPNVYSALTPEMVARIFKYVEEPQTGTTFHEPQKPGRGDILSSEVIYYMMFANQIPKECEKWHLSRLMTLLHVFAVKNEPPKKMSKKDVANRNRALNAARRKRLGTKG